jgi:hypothetical protein
MNFFKNFSNIFFHACYPYNENSQLAINAINPGKNHPKKQPLLSPAPPHPNLSEVPPPGMLPRLPEAGD